MMKLYESPSVEKCGFTAQEELLNKVPSVSEGGFGWDDVGPNRKDDAR